MARSALDMAFKTSLCETRPTTHKSTSLSERSSPFATDPKMKANSMPSISLRPSRIKSAIPDVFLAMLCSSAKIGHLAFA